MEPAATDIELAMFDDRDMRLATEFVFRSSWWVRRCCTRDAESERKIQQIAREVWRQCSARGVNSNTETTQMTCLITLEERDDYKETVSFIPVWILGFIIQIIVKLLIEFWLAKMGKGKWQTNHN